MPDRPATRQVCVLMREGLVLTDDRGRLPSYEAEQDWDDLARRTRTCGDHRAVLVAPQLQVRNDPAVVLSIRTQIACRLPIDAAEVPRGNGCAGARWYST